MTRIGRRFNDITQRGERALVAYITGGDPSLDASLEYAKAIADAGVDILEFGVPFSDPVADGPTIQAASQRALANGASAARVIGLVRRLREHTEVPVCFLTYGNVVHKYGYERFARDSADAGVDGVLICDVPPEDGADWLAAARGSGLDTVFMVAPTSTQETIDKVGGLATGFVYCVSRAGITGARDELPPELPAFITRVRQAASAPVFVGFGISTPDQVRLICGHADGAIVGSAIVDRVARGDTPAEVGRFCAELKEAAL